MSLVVKSQQEWDTLMKHEFTFVVDFTAKWCGPCRAIGPTFEALSKLPEYASLAFLKVDVDLLPDVAQAANVSAMPTFQVWRGGSAVAEMVGANKDKLVELLEPFLCLSSPLTVGQEAAKK